MQNIQNLISQNFCQMHFQKWEKVRVVGISAALIIIMKFSFEYVQKNRNITSTTSLRIPCICLVSFIAVMIGLIPKTSVQEDLSLSEEKFQNLKQEMSIEDSSIQCIETIEKLLMQLNLDLPRTNFMIDKNKYEGEENQAGNQIIEILQKTTRNPSEVLLLGFFMQQGCFAQLIHLIWEQLLGTTHKKAYDAGLHIVNTQSQSILNIENTENSIKINHIKFVDLKTNHSNGELKKIAQFKIEILVNYSGEKTDIKYILSSVNNK